MYCCLISLIAIIAAVHAQDTMSFPDEVAKKLGLESGTKYFLEPPVYTDRSARPTSYYTPPLSQSPRYSFYEASQQRASSQNQPYSSYQASKPNKSSSPKKYPSQSAAAAAAGAGSAKYPAIQIYMV